MNIESVVVFSVKAFFLVGMLHSICKGKIINCMGMAMVVTLIAGLEWNLPKGMGFMSIVNGEMDQDQALEVIVGAMMFSGLILGMCICLIPSIAKCVSGTEK